MDGDSSRIATPAPKGARAMFADALSEHISGRLLEAESLYRRILGDAPGHQEATHFLGVLLHQQGHSEEGIALVRMSLQASPDQGEWHNTLGNMLAATGQDAEAVAVFMAALEADASHAQAWNNLGSLLLRHQQTGEAIAAFENAVAIDPAFEDALYNLGDAQAQAGDDAAAARSRCAAYVLRPVADKPRRMLGVAYSVLGRFGDAARMYEEWLGEEPGHPEASHLLAAVRGNGGQGGAPERASDAYLAAYFDGLAESFEHKLVDTLHYGVPPLVGQVLRGLGTAPRSLRILDAGCGTGLCGLEAAPFAKRLVGVDLSARSLAVAADKGVYSSLQEQEVVAHMQVEPAAAFDVVIAADTLVYFGEIGSFLAAAAHTLVPGGLLIASFEELLAAGEGGYAIASSGRYSHRRSLVRERLASAGFDAPEITDIDVRNELAQPVKGFLVVARRGPAEVSPGAA